MTSITASSQIKNVNADEEWNYGNDSETLMHTIHPYPAKFPAFIAFKAFKYAQQEGVNVDKVADVFCGCGTVALEAKLNSKDFWGCDISPVATLIAKAKSNSYKKEILNRLYNKISDLYQIIKTGDNLYTECNKRLGYWFTERSYIALYKLKQSIMQVTRKDKYRDAFLCIFSSILKASSKWLSKSIKPQIDPNKNEIDIFKTFSLQYQKFIRALDQIEKQNKSKRKIDINHGNFLEISNLPKVDLIISSPPYVTSYEYADLHQLSTLWLQYAEDYRKLRKGSIGSVYNSENFKLKLHELNAVGREIVQDLLNNGKTNSKVRSVARYYSDMQKTIQQCNAMLNNAGMVFFVVGDTEYAGVRIRNSEHLVRCLIDEGFIDIKATKRRISNKLLTPYRDSIGRFSSDKSQRKIYHEEFIVSGRSRR
jgi:methylase of polypeptide subunit release factors